MAFFAISLLVGHFVGRNHPSGAIGLFVATYFIKVVGFAVVLFAIGSPEWLNGRWFLIGAVVTVVLGRPPKSTDSARPGSSFTTTPRPRKAAPMFSRKRPRPPDPTKPRNP